MFDSHNFWDYRFTQSKAVAEAMAQKEDEEDKREHQALTFLLEELIRKADEELQEGIKELDAERGKRP